SRSPTSGRVGWRRRMLRVLLASQPARAGWLGGTTFSTVTHGTLIALAVVASGTTISTVHEDRAAEPPERITYVEPARIADALKQADVEKAAVKKAAAPVPAPAAADPLAPGTLDALKDAASEAIQIPDVTAATDLTAVTD